MNHLISIVTLLLISSTSSFSQYINSSIVRDTVTSKLLGDSREVSIYLPPSYYSTKQSYPVLYILDGDYNFSYVSGLLELESSISENIPEMILVAISGKGSETYRENCKPNFTRAQDKGNADLYMDFIEKELIPYIDLNYNTLDYKILAGHSVGGLFIINTVLNKPNLFNCFIAISPSLWWEERAINKIAEKQLKNTPGFKSNVYVSLANEKDMGIHEFFDLIGKFEVDSSFHFKQFPDENHNSVGMPTYIWALRDLFSKWRTEKKYFDTAQELKDYHAKTTSTYGHSFNLKSHMLNYSLYLLQNDKEKLEEFENQVKKLYPQASPEFDYLLAKHFMSNNNYEEAKALLTHSIEEHSNNYNHYNLLAKIYFAEDKNELAKKTILLGINLANRQMVRRWQLNELLETKEKIGIIDN